MVKTYSIRDNYGVFEVLCTTPYKQDIVAKYDDRNIAFDTTVDSMADDDLFNHDGNIIPGKYLKAARKEHQEHKQPEIDQYNVYETVDINQCKTCQISIQRETWQVVTYVQIGQLLDEIDLFRQIDVANRPDISGLYDKLAVVYAGEVTSVYYNNINLYFQTLIGTSSDNKPINQLTIQVTWLNI